MRSCKSVVSSVRTAVPSWLQWGHDREDVEMPPMAAMQNIAVMLQWGHNQQVVEIPLRLADILADVPASMEKRP